LLAAIAVMTLGVESLCDRKSVFRGAIAVSAPIAVTSTTNVSSAAPFSTAWIAMPFSRSLASSSCGAPSYATGIPRNATPVSARRVAPTTSDRTVRSSSSKSSSIVGISTSPLSEIGLSSPSTAR
jgi:hypothetical protein